MKNIIFIAPPAAGKGTQSDLLVEKYGYIHISTGDLLREEIAAGGELANEISSIIEAGKLVSDELVATLLTKRLSQDDVKKHGFILDGYPRNIAQAKTLEEILEEVQSSVDVVIYLELDEENAMKRALGRATCPKCKKGYNLYLEGFKPNVDGICDNCGTALETRSDDNEETFKSRFQTYMDSTSPLLEFYRAAGLLRNINSLQDKNKIFEEIESVIQ
ncbi:MAG: adenylate kinase [Bacilli bacterium]|nr:adenylate kinase [Bacilli bacterium]